MELYFCEECGQSFSDPSLLSAHECIELSRGQLTSIPQLQGLSLGLTNQELVSGEEPAVHQTPVQNLMEESKQDLKLCTDPTSCPICQVEFALPSELKEHFKVHHKPQRVQVCPEEGCHFSSEDHKQVREHLQCVHQVSPVVCAYRGCLLLFSTQEDMELHHRSHFPFHCEHCKFISASPKQFQLHRRSHQQEEEAVLEAEAAGDGSFTAMASKE